ncbi:MAG: aminopeptidase N [Acidimicrobiales bacterium]
MTEDNLTRAEAQDRATKVAGVSYEVVLDLTGDGDTFVSDTTIRFTAPLVGLATFVDLDAAGVREVTLNGQVFDPSIFDPDRSRLPLRTLLANNELRVVADCRYQHTGVGLHRFVDPTDSKTYLHTQFEPYDAHRVFTCFDQPDLKATFTLTVVAPDDWTVVSNNPVVEREKGRWRFDATPEIPTYLAAVVAGPYSVVRDRHRDIDMAIFCRESLASFLDAEELFELTRQGLDFFEAEFACEYPFEKYDQLFVPEFNFGAMENPGCITFNEGMIFRSRQTDSAHENRANTLLHEMAHMWFGDLVTMRWWDDLWLNESFATYMATAALARATRFTDSWVRFASGTKAHAVMADQLPSTHPIFADIVDTDAVRLHFDGITYSKGASVLRQLVAWVGQDAFVEGVRRYFPRHQWANAELADFLGALEETSGRKLEPWSRLWLETAGVNTLRAEVEVADDGTFSSFAVRQEALPGHPTLRSHRVAIGLYRTGADGKLVRDRRLELDVDGARTEVPSLVGENQPDLLLLNDDDLTYAKVRLDDRSLATLEARLSAVEDPLARNLCWAAAWDMVRDAEMASRRWSALVVGHAPAEPDDTTLARLLAQAVAATDNYTDPACRVTARGGLATAARAGLAGAEPGSDQQLAWARHLLAVADGADDLSWARGLLDGSTLVPGLAVDTDLRWAVVGTLAAAGETDAEALIAAELDRDPTDIGRRQAASARTSQPVAAAKEEAWRQLMAPGLHLAELRAVAGSFWQHGQEDMLAPYVEPYFESVGQIWNERTRDEALSLLRGLYPRTLIRPEVVTATDRALADEALAGPVRRVLAEGKDGVERALRARAADRDPSD